MLIKNKNDNKVFSFTYGITSKPLKEQAEKQGFILHDAEQFEKIRTSINTLRVNKYISSKEADEMISRLHKEVLKKLRKAKV